MDQFEMTQDEIIAMAREAGLRRFGPLNIDKELERFAALVAAHEREACAKVVESGVLGHGDCAAAIRERSNANARARGEK